VGAAAALALAIFLLGTSSASSRTAAVSAAAASSQTTVSISFDDGSADQYQGLAMLNAHSMQATYYLNSAKISGDSGYMTWAQIADLAAAGNEIAGHTAYHVDLPFIDPTDAHSGSHAENLNINSWTNGDRKFLTAFNGTCSLATSAGRQYTISVRYKSTAKPVIFAFTSTTGPTGAYSYLAQSPQQTVSAGWTQATWTTPAMPTGTTNLSIGMGLSGQTGSLTMDDFGAFLTR